MDGRYQKFLALAETGSFSGAARQLHMTQPAMSLAIASLEHTLGVRLYIRRSHPIALTPEGQIVADAARNIAAAHERMLTTLQAKTPTERLRIGLIDSIAHLLYESGSARSSLSNNTEVLVDNSDRILRALREGRIDLGVITGQPAVPGANMVVRKLHNEEFVFVATPERASTHTNGRIDDWLATNPDSTTYKYFLDLFKRKHLEVTPVFHSASMELLREMAVAGQGTALLPRYIVQPALASDELAIVQTQPVFRPIWAVTRRGQTTPLLQSLTRRLNDLLAKVTP